MSLSIPVPLRDVTSALGLLDGGHVAIVGGGGKSTLLHTLGRQMLGPTILTTTTKMGTDQTGGRPTLIDPSDAEVEQALRLASPVVVWSATDGTKAIGVTPEACSRWFGSLGNVVIEADGARRRPFKAPMAYEPVVPKTVTHMVSVIGLDALDNPIIECCHRPDRVAALAGCSVDDRLTPERAASVLLHPGGARRALPPSAGFSVVVTKVRPMENDQALADALTNELGAGTDVAVVLVEFDPTVS